MTSCKRTWIMATLGCLVGIMGGFLLLLSFPPEPMLGEVQFTKHDTLVGEAIPLAVQLVLPWGEMPAQLDLSLLPGSQLRLVGRRSKLESVGLGTWEWQVNLILQALQAGTFADERLQVSFRRGAAHWADLKPISVRWPEVEPDFIPMPVGPVPPTTSPSIAPYLIGVLVAASVGLALVLLFQGRRTFPTDTPLAVVLSSLESLRESGDDAEELGLKVDRHLRIYLSRRTGQNVQAMTAAELENLQNLLPSGLLSRLQQLCRDIDQIKYAPTGHGRELNPELLSRAIDWVTDCDAALRRREGHRV